MLSSDPPTGHASLRRRLLKGGAWTFAGYGLSQVVRFAGNLIMTRLLAPDVFAVMGIATIIMVGLLMFSDLGIKPVVVRSARGNEPIFLNTAWLVQIARGMLLWLIALVVSAAMLLADHVGLMPKGSVYADPRLPYVIAAVSFSVVISGFNSTRLYEASRDLALGRLTVIEVTAQVAGLSFILTWLYFDRSISALVCGNIFSASVTLFLSHVWLPGTFNQWQWSKSAFLEIMHFGKWIFVSSLITFLVGNGDRLVLGGMVSSDLMGVSVIAFMIVGTIEAVLMRVIGSVVFPALSETIRQRPDKLLLNYYRMHAVLAAIAYLSSGVLMTFGQSLIRMLYDPRYAQAGWMLEILAVTVLVFPLQAAIQSFVALGMPKLQSLVLTARLVLMAVAMPVGLHYFGLPGALWGDVVSQLATVPIIIFYSARYHLFDLKRELLLLPVFLMGIGLGKLMTHLAPF